MWINLIRSVGAQDLNDVHTFPSVFLQIHSSLGLWTEGPMSTRKAADALLVPVFCFSPICTCFVYSPLLGKTKRGEDDLEIHSKSVPLIHTKTWRCPRAGLWKGSWCDFPKAESWSLLCSIPF